MLHQIWLHLVYWILRLRGLLELLNSGYALVTGIMLPLMIEAGFLASFVVNTRHFVRFVA